MSDITLLLKYETPQVITDIITTWLYSDAFQTDFLIPAFEECNPGVIHNGNSSILNQFPYRLFMLKLHTPQNTYETMTYTFVENTNNQERVPNVNYISYTTLSTKIPDNVLKALIFQMIIDTYLTNKTQQLCLCDLYLSRNVGSANLFHQDSGKYQNNTQLLGHENLEYLSLLYLSRTPGKLLRGTGIISSNLMRDTHHSMISLRTQSGTKLIIHDGAFFHCTPSTILPRDDTIHQVFPSDDTITAIETSITNNFTEDDITKIQNAGPREFVRGHYINTPRYSYTDIVTSPITEFMVELLKTVIAQREGIGQITYTINQQPESLNMVLSKLSKTNLIIGGKNKSKKNKGNKGKNSRKRGKATGGGKAPGEMHIISCDRVSFYALSKFNTNLSVIF